MLDLSERLRTLCFVIWAASWAQSRWLTYYAVGKSSLEPRGAWAPSPLMSCAIATAWDVNIAFFGAQIMRFTMSFHEKNMGPTRHGTWC